MLDRWSCLILWNLRLPLKTSTRFNKYIEREHCQILAATTSVALKCFDAQFDNFFAILIAIKRWALVLYVNFHIRPAITQIICVKTSCVHARENKPGLKKIVISCNTRKKNVIFSNICQFLYSCCNNTD